MQEWLSGGYTSQQILTASQAQHPDDDTAEPELLQDVLNTAAPHHESSVSTDSLPNVREADAVPHMAGDVSDSSEDNPAQGSEYGSESPPNRPATGGTLIVAPPSVVKAVWARELLSKVYH